MDGGIDEYRGREIECAVETVFFNAREVGLLKAGVTADELIEPAWDFVAQVMEEEGFGRPDRAYLEGLVVQRLPDFLDELE